MADPNWADVASLLHFDGADASTTFTDETGKVWTAVGDAQIDTSESKFGGSSGLFDGSGDNISATSTDFALGTGDFTIECFIRVASFAVASGLVATPNTDPGSYVFGITVDSRLRWFADTTSNFISINTQTHVAVTRSGSTVRLFIDGILGATITDSTDYTQTSLRVAIDRATAYFDGHIDELRITKGVARYIAAFSPPTQAFSYVPTIPTDYIAHYTMDNISGATLVDESANGYDGTITGATAVAGYIGNALSFDGVDDKVAMSSTLPPSGSCSISFWLKRQSGDILRLGNASSSSYKLLMISVLDAAITVDMETSTNDWSVSSISTPPTDEWFNVIVTVTSGLLIKAFVNSAEVLSDTAPSQTGVRTNFEIGYFYDGYGQGVVDQFRIYDRALTQSEITVLFEETSTLVVAGALSIATTGQLPISHFGYHPIINAGSISVTGMTVVINAFNKAVNAGSITTGYAQAKFNSLNEQAIEGSIATAGGIARLNPFRAVVAPLTILTTGDTPTFLFRASALGITSLSPALPVFVSHLRKPNIVGRKYRCFLSAAGFPTEEIPISNISQRLSDTGISTTSVTCSNGAAYADIITERVNGTMLVQGIEVYSDGSEAFTDSSEYPITYMQSHKGSKKFSLVITGQATIINTAPKQIVVTGGSYITDDGQGKIRLRCSPDKDLLPGDTIEFEGSIITVSSITTTVSKRLNVMEIVGV